MLLGSLILDHEPLELSDVPSAVASWLRDAGGLFAFGLAIVGIAYLARWSAGTAPGLFQLSGLDAVADIAQQARRRRGALRALAFLTLAAASFALYVLFAALLLVEDVPTRRPVVRRGEIPETIYTPTQNLVLTLAGALAVAAVVLPILLDLWARIRWRRIWALARLSLKEAWSKGIVWVALIIPFIYLYSDYYLAPSHPKDQLAHRIQVVYFALTILFVVSALLLGSFSIPTDVRNQTIHTVVTKPVERYEIVLGRFLGFALLLLGELLVLAAISLFYVMRNLHPEAEQESLRARVPLFATKQTFYRTAGESVGREWEYRKYIGGADPRGGGEPPYAIWLFQQLPGHLAERTEPVRVEFSFDIFRTTKSRDEKIQGVQCTFTFAPGHLTPLEVGPKVASWDSAVRAGLKAARAKVAQLRQQVTQEVASEVDREGLGKEARDRKVAQQVEARLAEALRREMQQVHDKAAEDHGVYAARSVAVADYVTQALPGDVPAGLFRRLAREQGKEQNKAPGEEGPAPALQVLVNLERTSGPQMLGVAPRDLYILTDEQPFWLNFLKGSLGLWFAACLVLGIALTCSTYLSGVISLQVAAFLCGAGLFVDYIKALASGTISGGGPFEAGLRMLRRQNVAVQMERSPTLDVLQGLDDVYRWYLRQVLSVIPDVKRFSLTNYVASGFDISWGQVLFADALLPLLGYLIPCGVLAYYLMNSREIANPT
jgi:ABC-type transport system involved in multi-copper enzyme maturation permease subunit